MKVILLNGPPSSGKDTAALAIRYGFSKHLTYVLRMSHPIKEAFAGMLHERLDGLGNNALRERRKEEVIATLSVSYRQWQIDFSERFMKPLYGSDVFARIWLHRAAQLARDTIIIVPDCGFQIELDTLLEAAETNCYPYFTPGDILLLHLHRRGCDYRNDSREYVDITGRDIFHKSILNEDLDRFHSDVTATVRSFLEQSL